MSAYADYSEEEGIQHYADKVNACEIAICTHARTILGYYPKKVCKVRFS
jgi:hypothetical protein